MITTTKHDDHVLEIVISEPPVNAYGLELLQQLRTSLAGVDSDVHAVVIRAEGRGFCAGGDVKEVQKMDGFEGLLGQTTLSLAVSRAIEDCPVPVVAAIHGYCIGVGVLIAGVCDVLVVQEGTQFVMAEADNGATSGAVQALALLPEKRVRTAMFTCEPIDAQELLQYGSLYALTDGDSLVTTAMKVARTIAAKSTDVIRGLKASINASVGRDLERAYRTELSYTFELNLRGEADRVRDEFVEGTRRGYDV